MDRQQHNVTVQVSIPKSLTVAYVLWVMFGMLGVHRFYLGKNSTGLVMLLLTVIGGFTMIFIIGFFLIGTSAIWWLVDAFQMPGMVRSSSAASTPVDVIVNSSQVSRHNSEGYSR